MNDLVSVIIPVYNSSKYLSELLDSVISQDYVNLEILCIDDGSQDTSLEILKQYAAIDDRIRIIEKRNTGVSDTRNIGIESSTGSYIYFCDSDDILERTLILNLHTAIIGHDLSCVDFLKYEGQFTFSDENVIVDRDAFCKLVLGDNGYLWNKLFIANVIKNNGIRFCQDIAICEDQVFVIEYLKYVHSVQINKSQLYFYRFNENSALGSKVITDKKLTVCLAADKIVSLVKDGNYSQECLDLALRGKVVILSNCLKDLLLKQSNKKIRSMWLGYIADSYRETRKYKVLLDKNCSIKLKIYYAALKVLGAILK